MRQSLFVLGIGLIIAQVVLAASGLSLNIISHDHSSDGSGLLGFVGIVIMAYIILTISSIVFISTFPKLDRSKSEIWLISSLKIFLLLTTILLYISYKYNSP